MAMTTFMNSLQFLFDPDFIPQQLEISIEDEFLVCIKASGSSLGKINLSQFIEKAPPFDIDLRIESKIHAAAISISKNSIKSISEEGISVDPNNETIKITLTLCSVFEDIKTACVDFMSKNEFKMDKISISDKRTEIDVQKKNKICEPEDHSKSIADSLTNIIMMSQDSDFRRRCIDIFKNNDESQTIHDIILKKLRNIENDKKTNSRTSL